MLELLQTLGASPEKGVWETSAALGKTHDRSFFDAGGPDVKIPEELKGALRRTYFSVNPCRVGSSRARARNLTQAQPCIDLNNIWTGIFTYICFFPFSLDQHS